MSIHSSSHMFAYFQSSSSSLLALTPKEERYWRLVKVILDDMLRHLRELFQSAFQTVEGMSIMLHKIALSLFTLF